MLKEISSAIKHTCVFLLAGLVFSVSCKKEHSCANCGYEGQSPLNPNGQVNRPPLANAGKDSTILFPANQVTLDGSASSDPDNNISGFLWRNISGPSGSNILKTNSIKTNVTDLSEGIYEFTLTVTDSGGLYSIDTVMIIVSGKCPIIHARLIPFGILSEARYGMAVAYAGTKILFAGGVGGNTKSTRVDIYNISTNTWSVAELSTGRTNITAASDGNKIFFAGGDDADGAASAKVDIYDASNNTWSNAELSEARYLLASAAGGGKIIFAGGYNPAFTVNGSDRVDIFDNSSNTWSIAKLSQARWGLSASAVGNKIYIAGGEAPIASSPAVVSGKIVGNIDIYDALTNTWSYSTLGETKGYMASISVDDQIYWAGGVSSINYALSNKVEIKDAIANTSSYMPLCNPTAGIDAVACHINNSILFFPGQGFGLSVNQFNIYDISTHTCSIGLFDQKLTGPAIISVDNKVYVAGGQVNGVLSNQVWTLEF